MKVEFREGSKDMLEYVTGEEPVLTCMGGLELEIEVETTRGRVLMGLVPGDPCEITQAEVEAFRAALDSSLRKLEREHGYDTR